MWWDGWQRPRTWLTLRRRFRVQLRVKAARHITNSHGDSRRQDLRPRHLDLQEAYGCRIKLEGQIKVVEHVRPEFLEACWAGGLKTFYLHQIYGGNMGVRWWRKPPHRVILMPPPHHIGELDQAFQHADSQHVAVGDLNELIEDSDELVGQPLGTRDPAAHPDELERLRRSCAALSNISSRQEQGRRAALGLTRLLDNGDLKPAGPGCGNAGPAPDAVQPLAEANGKCLSPARS